MATAFPGCVKPLLLVTLTLACCATALPAATLERLSLDDMIVKSTSIVRGKVLSSYSTSSGPVIYTNYRLQVSETFKGTPSTSMEVQMPGGTVNHVRQTFAGVPQFDAGEEFVFFLWSGKSGAVQVLGLTQGLFAMPGDTAADPLVTRPASAETMLERGTGKQVRDQTLTMHLSELRARINTTLANGRRTTK